MKSKLVVAMLMLASLSPLDIRAGSPGAAAPRTADSTGVVAATWRVHRPRFAPVGCWFADDSSPLVDGVQCGTVNVPEDRSDPASGMISLAVMTIPASVQPARSGGLLWIDPGPGNASISTGRVRLATTGRLAALRRDVDLVFFDQRGTGYSGRDVCRTVKDSWAHGVQLEPEGERLFTITMRRCLESARAEGVPIDAYSSWHIALDARDIRIALGLEEWNVFAFATSTEIAQAMLQIDEEGVRSVVLDSPVPTQPGLGRAASLNMDHALRRLAGLCRQQARCAATQGDLHQRLLSILDAYERAPLLIEGLNPEAATRGRLVFDDRIAANFVMFMIYSANGHADLPVVLSALEDRDVGALRNYAQAWFQPPDGRDSQLTRYAIKCRNNSGGRHVAAAELARAQREAPGLYSRLGLFRYDDDCKDLPYGPPDPSVRATRSGVPALITDGRLNPVGTVEASQTLAAGFPNGQMVLFPHAGVDPVVNDIGGCGGSVLRAFLADPLAPLDTGCVQRNPPPRFTTDFRRTSVPGRLLIDLSNGVYPVVPALIVLSLVVPFLVLPVAWSVRGLRRTTPGGNVVTLAGLVSWIAVTVAIGAVVHFAMTLMAWSQAHRVALPAAAPQTVTTSAGIAAAAGALALVALVLASRRRRLHSGGTSLLLAGWCAVAALGSAAWIFWAIRALQVDRWFTRLW